MLNGVSVARRNSRKSTLAHDLRQAQLAGLGAQGRADLLIERGRHAHRGRERVEHAPHGVEIVREAVAGHRLNQHQRSVGLQRLAGVRRRTGRVAHVVQRIEHRDEVEVLAREVLGARGLEAHVGQVLGVLLGVRDRRTMEVDSDELRLRERRRHDDGRGAVAAADVGDLRSALQLLHHAVQSRQPSGEEVRPIARPEEALDAAEQAVATIAPADAFAGAEGLLETRLVGEHRRERVEAAGHVHHAGIVREYRRLLGRQREGLFARVVGDEAGSGLRRQPLPHQALVGAGPGRQLVGGHRAPIGHRAIEAQPVAGEDQGGIGCSAKFVNKCSEQGLELFHIQSHGSIPSCVSRASPDAMGREHRDGVWGRSEAKWPE